tara:strand:+ start:347 stop:826 length:480 start_codon:yes stop_codon:yes gene_type:complete
MSYVCVFDKPVDKEVPNLSTFTPSTLSPSLSPLPTLNDECSISCENDGCPCIADTIEKTVEKVKQLVELPEGFSKPLKGSYEEVVSNIPRVPGIVLDILKEALKSKQISKVMFNKIISMKVITYKQLQDKEKVQEVLLLLGKKVPLKKCVSRIYDEKKI